MKQRREERRSSSFQPEIHNVFNTEKEIRHFRQSTGPILPSQTAPSHSSVQRAVECSGSFLWVVWTRGEKWARSLVYRASTVKHSGISQGSVGTPTHNKTDCNYSKLYQSLGACYWIWKMRRVSLSDCSDKMRYINTWSNKCLTMISSFHFSLLSQLHMEPKKVTLVFTELVTDRRKNN